jgi:hypothetical protein
MVLSSCILASRGCEIIVIGGLPAQGACSLRLWIKKHVIDYQNGRRQQQGRCCCRPAESAGLVSGFSLSLCWHAGQQHCITAGWVTYVKAHLLQEINIPSSTLWHEQTSHHSSLNVTEQATGSLVTKEEEEQHEEKNPHTRVESIEALSSRSEISDS